MTNEKIKIEVTCKIPLNTIIANVTLVCDDHKMLKKNVEKSSLVAKGQINIDNGKK